MAELTEFKRNLRKVLSNADEVAAMGLDFWALAPSLVPFAWFDAVANIPTGWQVCDGTNGTPAMDGYFVVGSSTVAGTVTAAQITTITDHFPSNTSAADVTTTAGAGAVPVAHATHLHGSPQQAHTVSQDYVPPSVSFIWIMKV